MMNGNTVENLESRGYQFSLDGEKLVWRGQAPLPDNQIESMRANKAELVAWIKARDKLSIVAESLGCQMDELLDFYQNDMADIARMSMDALRFIVRDYIQYRNALS